MITHNMECQLKSSFGVYSSASQGGVGDAVTYWRDVNEEATK